jgi:type IV pilus assembly protein PilP
MKRNRNSTCLVALLLLLVLGGCSKPKEPAARPSTSNAPQAKLAAKPALPLQKQLSSAAVKPGMHLDFKTRTDPFKPFATVEAVPAGKAAPESRHLAQDLLPIQSFDVAKFKVAGIIAGLKENRALLIDPNGKGYVVQEGMLIGSNDGRITRISASAVEVVEVYKEGRSKVKRKIVLTLAKKR